MSVQQKNFKAIADAIREKTGETELIKPSEFADKIEDVYEAGQSSMVDESKLIPKTVSGAYISVDDVSEIPHSVGCKVESVNLFDINRFAEELQSTDHSSYPTHFGTDGEYEYIAVSAAGHTGFGYMNGEFEEDTQYTLSFSGKTSVTYAAGLSIYYIDGSRDLIRFTTSWTYHTHTTAANKTVRSIRLYTYSNDYGLYSNIMLNKGTEALPYTPYVSPESVQVTKYGVDESEGYQTLTPNADGTVEGMISVSPYMNIFTDTEGVNIEATYNKSYGMQTEYDRFWDVFQNKGARISYTQGFSYARFNDTTFKPKYDLIVSTAAFMFAYYNTASESMLSQYGITDLAKCLENAGVVLDTSKATNLNHLFYTNKTITHVPPISFESCTALESNFYGCDKLVTIDKLIFKADGTNTIPTVSYSLPFGQCVRLQNIEVEGTIGDNISFANSPLTKDSITSIINALSATTSGKTLTLKLSAVNTAFETSSGAGDGSTSEEFAALVATKTNWTITMV